MGVEIERKFLVTGEGWRQAATGRGTRLRQAYLVRSEARTVRVREQAGVVTLTIKGPGGLVRPEFEYVVPTADADGLFALCERGRIDKTRHLVHHARRTWEVDEFHGVLAGLVLAEVELEHADAHVELPAWVGAEVTDDPEYTNAALSRRT